MHIRGLPIQALLFDTLWEKSFFYAREMFSDIANGQFDIEKLIQLYNAVPVFAWAVFFSVLKIAFCFVLLSLKKSFFEQICAALLDKPPDVLKYGVSVVFMLVSLELMFFFSVVGIPLSIILVIVMFLMITAGEVSLSINLGYFICQRLVIRATSYTYLLLGILIIEVICNIPYVGAVAAVCMSALSLGAVILGAVNGFIKKQYYDIRFETGTQRDNANNEHIRKILLGKDE